MKKYAVTFLLVSLFLLAMTSRVRAWSNGGYSESPPPSTPDYGTHDWIAEHAKNWLPANERAWIDDNLNCFLYGTEYPDNPGAAFETTYGYGDTTKHHNYYDESGNVIDDSAAVRAKEEYYKALNELRVGREDIAAIYAGSMTHYIADVASFGHVVEGETYHREYESYVQARTSVYDYGVFEYYLVFNGTLEDFLAYDASIALGLNTYNDDGGTYTCFWMDLNYDWNDPNFKDRCGESLNLAVNYVTDVLHTLVTEASLLFLNIKTIDWNREVLPSCNVTVNGVGSKTSDLNGWANFTAKPGVYSITVLWHGIKVNQTSITITDVDVTIDIICHVWELTINAKDSNGTLLSADRTQIFVTLPNGTHLNLSHNTAAYKVMNGTFFFAVRYMGVWVYENSSIKLDVFTTVEDLLCEVYDLTVNVDDLLGFGAYGADVALYWLNGSLIASKQTDFAGKVTFSQLPKGDYLIQISYLGQTLTEEVSLTRTTTKNVKVNSSLIILIPVILMAIIVAVFLVRRRKR